MLESNILAPYNLETYLFLMLESIILALYNLETYLVQFDLRYKGKDSN